MTVIVSLCHCITGTEKCGSSLLYRERKYPEGACAADGAEKVIFTAAGREKITLKNGDTAYRYKGYTMFPVGGSDVESVMISIGPYRKCPTRLGDLFNNSPGRRRDVLYWLKYVDEVYEPATEEERNRKKQSLLIWTMLQIKEREKERKRLERSGLFSSLPPDSHAVDFSHFILRM